MKLDLMGSLEYVLEVGQASLAHILQNI